MHFISKKEKEILGRLSKKQEEVLRNPAQYNEKERENLLETLLYYRSRSWLVCSCNDPFALLVVCLNKGKVFVKCKERLKHKEQCSFFLKGVEISVISQKTLLPSKKVKQFNLYPKATSILAQKKKLDRQSDLRTITRLG